MSTSSEYPDDLHCDLGEPYPITQRGNWFYLGIRDGATGTYYVEPMTTKSQVFAKFQKFICHVKGQSGKKLRRLRTDFGGEFANTAFQEFIAKEEIRCEPSALYTPE